MIRPKPQKVAKNFRYNIGVKRRLLLKELQIEFSSKPIKFLFSAYQVFLSADGHAL
jgi:hypothetical protein